MSSPAVARAVSPTTFAHALAAHWRGELGNVVNVSLIDAWTRYGEAMASALRGEYNGQFHVLALPTGCAKTEGLVIHATLLPRKIEQHPGGLIIVRTIEQGRELVERINRLSGWEQAKAHNSSGYLSPSAMLETPIIVTTHSSYERGAHGVSSFAKGMFAGFHSWPYSPTGFRRHVVIDEAVNLVEPTQVTLDDVKDLLRVLDYPNITTKHRDEIAALKFVHDTIADMMTMEQERQPGEVILTVNSRGEMAPYQRFSAMWDRQVSSVDLAPLRGVLEELPLDTRLLRRTDPIACNEIRQRLLGVLTGVQQTLRNWAYYSREGRGPALHTAAVLPGWSEIPASERPAVLILDATGQHTKVYDYFGAKVHSFKKHQLRHFKNVKLRVAWMNNTGKSHLENNTEAEITKLMGNLPRVLSTENKLLLVTHKVGIPQIVGMKEATGFAEFHHGNWMNLDGRNTWRDCTAVVLSTVPYPPRSWAVSTFWALRGCQDSMWLEKEGKAIRRDLEDSKIAVQQIQAANRICIRQVNDVTGGCPAGEILMALPKGVRGEGLLKRFLAAHPRIDYNPEKPWDYENAVTRRLPKTNHDMMLLAWAKGADPGVYKRKDVQRVLGLSDKQMERLLSKLHDPEVTLFDPLDTPEDPANSWAQRRVTLAAALERRRVVYRREQARQFWAMCFVKAEK